MTFDPSSDPRYEVVEQSSPRLVSKYQMNDPSTTSVTSSSSSENIIGSKNSIVSLSLVTQSSTTFGQHSTSSNDRKTSSDQEVSSSSRNVLRIKSVERKDSALYTCIAVNNFGKAEYNIQLMVQGKNNNNPRYFTATDFYSLTLYDFPPSLSISQIVSSCIVSRSSLAHFLFIPCAHFIILFSDVCP